jgi:two-component sensor histidine kinase
LIDISLTVSPVKNDNGKIIGASKIARDITERKRNEAQIAILAREAEHRVKNVLASVDATVHLSEANTPEDLKSSIRGRIRALANAHVLFAQSRWAGADVKELIKLELSPYCREGDGRARLEGASLMLEPRAAQAAAVILHELATNAAKYGALSVADGFVAVEWSQAVDGRLTLQWTEANGPRVNPPTRQGFGTRMMENVVAGQEGEIHFEWHPQGLSCEITMK